MKRLTRQQKGEKAVVDLINEMFKIAGHNVTFDDIKDRKDPWYNDWTMTEVQYNEWMKWGTKEYKKRFKLTEEYAHRQMAMIGLNWGLKLDKPIQTL